MGGEEYLYPEIFVRTDTITRRGLIVNPERGVVVRVAQPTKAAEPGSMLFDEVIYEDAYKQIVDLVEARVTRSFVVYAPWYDEYLLVEEGTRVDVIEVQGKSVFMFVREGDMIEEGERIAYITTGKMEVRVYRSPSTGIVVYMTRLLEPLTRDVYLLLVAGEGDVRRLRGAKATNT